MDDGPQHTESTRNTRDVDYVAAGPTSPLFFGPDGLRPLWSLLIYVFILTIPIAILNTLAHASHANAAAAGEQQNVIEPFTSIIMEWIQFAIVFFATWVMSRIEDRSVFDYGLSHSNRRTRWLVAGAFWGVLWLSVLAGILVLTHHLLIVGVLLRPMQGIRYGIEWAVMFVGVGFFEEFLFRGYLQFTLARFFADAVKWIAPSDRYAGPIGFWAAAALISFGFGFSHGFNLGESTIGMLCAGLAGLLFTLSLWRTGSLWWAIGMHAAWDWSQSFLFGVADSGSISQGRLLASHPAGSALMSGGVTGPEGSLLVLPIMVCITLVIVFTLPKRPTPFDAKAAFAPQSVPSPAVTSTEQ